MNIDDGYAAKAADWTPTDWARYREAVADGEGSAQTIDRINHQRQRKTTTAEAGR